jgi:hypothetical protein
LVDGNIDKTKDFGLVDHVALIEKMDASEVFNSKMEESKMSNLVLYFDALPAEARMKLFTTLTRANNQISADNGSNFHRELAKQGKVEAFIKLLGGK